MRDGDQVGNDAVHWRLRRYLGKADTHVCFECGVPAKQWAYDYSDPEPKVDPVRGPYSTDLWRYDPLCVSCHVRRDSWSDRARGRETYAPRNRERSLYCRRGHSKNGSRDCNTCRRALRTDRGPARGF